MDWTGLDWTGLDWTGLKWTGLIAITGNFSEMTAWQTDRWEDRQTDRQTDRWLIDQQTNIHTDRQWVNNIIGN